MIAIGIDVGGTHTRVGAVNQSGRLLVCRRCTTDRHAGGDAFVDGLIRSVEAVCGETCADDARVRAIGLALPGLIDRRRGVLVRSVNLRFLEGRGIPDELTRRTGLAVTLSTDADAATWAEYIAHPLRPERFIHLRLGTGVACGVVVNGALQDVGAGRTTHLDALIVDDQPDAVECRCGKRGCLEMIAAGPAMVERGRQAGYANGLGDLQRGWQRGDRQARAIVQHVAAAVSTAVANLTRHFQPEVISLGGGVTSQLPGLVEEATAHCRACDALNGCDMRVSLERSRLGDDAGVIGAALLASTSSREGRQL